MEKSVSLTHAEVAALLDMSLLTYAKVDEEVARSALCKLANLCREFDIEENKDNANVGVIAKV
ncbi:MAG: hypothetical protein QHH26_06390 [Armatimonadota bacterium]|nr:hypothetical protein [Armatimonadota bacterium]